MEIQKIVRTVTVAVMFVIFAVFFYFTVSMMGADNFDESWETWQTMFTIFPIMIGILVAVSVIGIIAARKGANVPYKNPTTGQKKCVACGTVMKTTDHSCPRCYTMQPVSPEDIRYIDHRTHNKK